MVPFSMVLATFVAGVAIGLALEVLGQFVSQKRKREREQKAR